MDVGRVGKAKRAHHLDCIALTWWARREARAFAHPTDTARKSVNVVPAKAGTHTA
jgi:hypothetical protein